MTSNLHLNVVQQAFTTQAPMWAGPVPLQLQQLVATLDLKTSDTVLDVAAGSCRVSRAIAPWVSHVTAVELTAAMLNQGQQMAQQEQLTNITFKLGAAENLEFADNQFDVTITRYSFHHFVDPQRVFKEMMRVTKAGGKVIVIDILSPEDESLADQYNRYERLRDPSHRQAPGLSQLKAWYQSNNLHLIECHTEAHVQDLEGWLDLPALPEQVKDQIREAVQQELSG
jgi:ubiquinone/menaquinone biosynthesis C-methylase UbiE